MGLVPNAERFCDLDDGPWDHGIRDVKFLPRSLHILTISSGTQRHDLSPKAANVRQMCLQLSELLETGDSTVSVVKD